LEGKDDFDEDEGDYETTLMLKGHDKRPEEDIEDEPSEGGSEEWEPDDVLKKAQDQKKNRISKSRKDRIKDSKLPAVKRTAQPTREFPVREQNLSMAKVVLI